MLRFLILTTAVGIIAGKIYYDSILAGLIIALLFNLLYPLYAKKECKKNEYIILNEFKDLLFIISSSFSLGRSMKQALTEANEYYNKNNLGFHYIPHDIEKMLYEMEVSNTRDIIVLRNFASKYNLAEIWDFVNVYQNCLVTGADIPKAIERTASVIGDKISIRNELISSMSEKILEGRIVLLSAPVMILFVRIMSPDYMKSMNETMNGLMLTTISLILSALSVILIERINNIEL